jgi:hypothetical protein
VFKDRSRSDAMTDGAAPSGAWGLHPSGLVGSRVLSKRDGAGPLAEQTDRTGVAELEIVDRRNLVSHHLRSRPDIHPW